MLSATMSSEGCEGTSFLHQETENFCVSSGSLSIKLAAEIFLS